MRRMVWSVVAAVILFVCAVPASAQLASSPMRFGLVGGGTFPVGNLSNVASLGWHAGALVDLGLPLVPLGFRVEGAWHQLGDKSFVENTPGGQVTATEKTRVIAVTPHSRRSASGENPSHSEKICRRPVAATSSRRLINES